MLLLVYSFFFSSGDYTCLGARYHAAATVIAAIMSRSSNERLHTSCLWRESGKIGFFDCIERGGCGVNGFYGCYSVRTGIILWIMLYIAYFILKINYMCSYI